MKGEGDACLLWLCPVSLEVRQPRRGRGSNGTAAPLKDGGGPAPSHQVLNSEPLLHRALSRTIEAAEREKQRQDCGGSSGFWVSREQEAVARALDRDFLLGGVHLPESGRQRVAELKQRIQLVRRSPLRSSSSSSSALLLCFLLGLC